MTKTRFFRYLWRANALLIFLATGAGCALVASLLLSEVGCNARRRLEAEAAPQVLADPSERLYLGPLKRVEGTSVLRAELLAGRQGVALGSGGYGTETRNILYFEPHSNIARWLLPDSSSVVSDETVVWAEEERESGDRRQLAVVTLVKKKGADSELDVGTLMIMDPEGRNSQVVSDGVRALSHAALTDDDRITLIFERQRKYVRAVIDRRSLKLESEVEVSVPALQ